MQKTLQRYLRRISLGYGVGVIAIGIGIALIAVGTRPTFLSLLASSASTLNGKPSVMYFAPQKDGPLQVGETRTIDININTRTPINAIGATVRYPSDLLEIVSISKERSLFDLWTEETSIKEGAGEIHFSGGTLKSGGHMGIGTLLTITIRAKKAARGEMWYSEAQIYGHDGRGATVDRDLRTLPIEVAAQPPVVQMSAPPSDLSARPSPDLNNDGRVTLADVSILAIQILAPYNARYDLNMDGNLGLSDLSIIFSRIRSN